jgi:hypothetical protein
MKPTDEVFQGQRKRSSTVSVHEVRNILLHLSSLLERRKEATEPRSIQSIIKVVVVVVLYECETWSLTLREEQTESVRGQSAEEDIRTKEGWSDGRVENTA